MSRSNRQETKSSMVSVISPLRTFLNETTQAGQNSYPMHYSISACKLAPTRIDCNKDISMPYVPFICGEIPRGAYFLSRCIRSSGLEERCTCNALVMGSNPIGYIPASFTNPFLPVHGAGYLFLNTTTHVSCADSNRRMIWQM